jgi:hypothetical protein
MSDTKVLSLLESMKQQLAGFIAQRDQAQVNFQQLIGAIFACETIIKQHEEKIAADLKEQGEGNGEDVDQGCD